MGVGSSNIAVDMFSNANAEATGIARDVMHHQQWRAVIEELGGFQGQLPIPRAVAQVEQMQGGRDRVASQGSSSPGMTAGGSAGTFGSEGIDARVKDARSTMANDATGRGRESGAKTQGHNP